MLRYEKCNLSIKIQIICPRHEKCDLALKNEKYNLSINTKKKCNLGTKVPKCDLYIKNIT